MLYFEVFSLGLATWSEAGSLAFVLGLLFFLMFAVLDTRRDVAYRYSPPGSSEMRDMAFDGQGDGWS